jgi:hypothetical protein
LASIPILIYGEQFESVIDNKTVIINITPTNQIILEENYTKLEQLLKNLNGENQQNLHDIISDLNKENVNEIRDVFNNQKDWSEGDLIIASSTIFAFFTFGSLLTIRYEAKAPEKTKLLDGISASIILIQVMHLFAILMIIFNAFSPILYAYIVGLTIIFLIIITTAIRKFFLLSNRITNRVNIAEDTFDFVLNQLQQSSMNNIDEKKESGSKPEELVKEKDGKNTTYFQDKYYDIKRDFDRMKRESGE